MERVAKPLSPEEFKDIYSRVPRISVDLLIQTSNGIVLSLRSHETWNGLWHLPGGGVQYQERIVEAIERIARNELNCEVTPIKFLGYIEYTSEQKERGFGSTIGLVFLCRTNAVEFTPNEDAERIEVFTVMPEKLMVEQQIFFKEHAEEIFTHHAH